MNELDSLIKNETDLAKKVRLVALENLHDQYELLKADEREAKKRYADLLKPLYARVLLPPLRHPNSSSAQTPNPPKSPISPYS